MPYIDQERRRALDHDNASPRHAGELNYLIFHLIEDYIREKGLHYQTLNDVTGVLESVKQELYRRLTGPYEDEKIAENGDISLFERPE
jgi:hypothetical protein